MDLDNGKWTIDSEGVESGGVEMHLFSLWCVPSGVRRVNKGYIQLPLVDIDLDSIFSSIPLKKMRSNSLKSPAFRINQVSGWLFRPLKQTIMKDTGWGNLEETVSVKNRLSLGKSYPPLTKLRRGEDRLEW